MTEQPAPAGTRSHVEGTRLPRLYVDHDFPDVYRDLVEGRAELVPLAEADAVVAGAVAAWNAAALADAPGVRVVSRVGVGYDNVDVDGLASVGVAACNAPMAPLVSTAEHTIALMLAITKRLPQQIDRAKQGLKGEPIGRALELDGATMGLIGLGRIATRVAVAAEGLGMSVIATDPFVDQSHVPGVQLVDADTLLGGSDVVSLHAPATAETAGMMDARAFASMRPGSYLVNCARGALVDQDALLDALDRGHLAGAGLDVTDPEPLPADHPLLHRDDVIVTPHVASNTVAGRRRLYEHAIDHALAFLAGSPVNVLQPSRG